MRTCNLRMGIWTCPPPLPDVLPGYFFADNSPKHFMHRKICLDHFPFPICVMPAKRHRLSFDVSTHKTDLAPFENRFAQVLIRSHAISINKSSRKAQSSTRAKLLKNGVSCNVEMCRVYLFIMGQ